MNLTNCSKCGRSIIIEELEEHECKKVMDYRIEGKILWLSDGKYWYPRKLKSTSPTKLEQPDKTTKDGSKPNYLINMLLNL